MKQLLTMCPNCGIEAMELFDTIRSKLSRGEHSGMKPVGQVFQLA